MLKYIWLKQRKKCLSGEAENLPVKFIYILDLKFVLSFFIPFLGPGKMGLRSLQASVPHLFSAGLNRIHLEWRVKPTHLCMFKPH